MVRKINLYVDQGTDFSSVVNIYKDARIVNNLQNHTFKCDVKKVFSSEQKAFSFDIKKIGYANNSIEISLSANTAVMPGKYQYDIIMTDPSNVKSKIQEGIVTVIETITITNL